MCVFASVCVCVWVCVFARDLFSFPIFRVHVSPRLPTGLIFMGNCEKVAQVPTRPTLAQSDFHFTN